MRGKRVGRFFLGGFRWETPFGMALVCMPWLLFCMLSVLFGELLSAVGYAVPYDVCMVRAVGGRVAG